MKPADRGYLFLGGPMHGKYVVVPDSRYVYEVSEARPDAPLFPSYSNDACKTVQYLREKVWWGYGNRKAVVFMLAGEDKNLLLRGAVDSGLLTT